MIFEIQNFKNKIRFMTATGTFEVKSLNRRERYFSILMRVIYIEIISSHTKLIQIKLRIIITELIALWKILVNNSVF